MAKVEIYTTPYCGFCHRAKSLLKDKGVEFDEVNIVYDTSRRAEMIMRANGQNTVPQIFIENQHVGGCNELYGLDAKGKLDPLLNRRETS